MIEKSKRPFGRSLIRKEERLSAYEVLNHYDPEVVKHACSAMFLPPDESTGGYVLQRIYDEVLRESVLRHALILKLLLRGLRLHATQQSISGPCSNRPAAWIHIGTLTVWR